MKKQLLIVLISMFTFVNCKKDIHLNDTRSTQTVQVPNTLLTKIKLWHENKIINQRTYLSKTTNQESSRKALLIPDYSRATYETLPNGATVTTVQADEFKFADPEIGFFRVFVFVGGKDEIVDGKIVEFYGDAGYLKRNRKYLIDNYNNKNLMDFTGSVFTYNIYYQPLRNRTFKDGMITLDPSGIVRKSSTAAKRAILNPMMASTTSVDCEAQGTRRISESECYDVYWVTAENAQYLYSYCCNEGGGTNPGGGGGAEPPVPISSFSGFPSNPIEGQTAVFIDPYGDRIEFTYSTSMQVWLMPELQSLRDIGNTLSITNMPVFDPGNILTAIALPAAFEPTFVGEVILAGAAAYVSTVYVYQLATWINSRQREEDNIHCNGFYVPCIQSGRQIPCDDCLHYCTSNGFWDFARCPEVQPIIE